MPTPLRHGAPLADKPTPSGGCAWSSLLPLGALAAGFGLSGLVMAQPATGDAAPGNSPPAQATAAEPATAGSLPVVRARAQADRPGKDTLQTTSSRIGKGQQELRDIPQSVTVVTERLIDDRNLDTLKEALHNTAGISFQAAEGGEEDIRLRGYSLQSTGDIFVDGLRDPAFYERDSFNWDRLELLRGSASMLFGRGSTGGAVNQVSKQAQLFGRNEVSLTVGNAGYLRSTADLNHRLGDNHALRVNLMSTQQDGAGSQRQNKLGAAFDLGLGIGLRDEFRVSGFYLNNDNGIHYGLPWIAPDAANNTASGSRTLVPVASHSYYGMASDHNRGTAGHLTLQHLRRLGAGSEWRSVARAGRYERDIRATTVRLCTRGNLNATTGLYPNPECPETAPTLAEFSDATLFTRGSPQPKVQDIENVTLQSDYSGRFQLAGMRHQVATGVDANREWFTNFSASAAAAKPKITVGNSDDGASIDEASRVLTENRSFNSKALGVHAQDLVQLAEHWKLLAGLRWDQFSGTYNSPPTTAVPAGTHRARSDSLWSKRLGLLWQPNALASYHLSYGTSFNTSGDTYQYDALGSNTPPEGSVNYELGAKLDLLEGRLSLRTALFHAVKTNERNRDSESVTPTTYVLSGQRHAQGVELDVAGRITKDWDVFLSYALIPVARIDKGVPAAGGTAAQSLQGEPVGSRPGLIPRHSASLWTTWQMTPQWRVGGGLTARSKMAPYQITSFTAPGYVGADLMAEYTVGDLAYKLNITNLADKLYADYLYRGHWVPGKGRTVQLTGSYRF